MLIRELNNRAVTGFEGPFSASRTTPACSSSWHVGLQIHMDLVKDGLVQGYDRRRNCSFAARLPFTGFSGFKRS
jgi:hypothetical protein